MCSVCNLFSISIPRLIFCVLAFMGNHWEKQQQPALGFSITSVILAIYRQNLDLSYMAHGSKEILLAVLEQRPAYTSIIELKMGMSLSKILTNL